MRILAVTNLYPTPLQPQRAAYNRQHFREFAREHAVHVVAPIPWTDELREWRSGAPSIPAGRRVRLDGISIDHPRYWFIPKILRRRYGEFFRWSVERAVARAVEEFKPHILFSSWAYPDGWAALELGHAAGLPVVVNVVGSDVLCCDAPRIGRLVETVTGADGIIAASRDLAQRVIALGASAERVRAIHNGVDPELFHPGDRKRARETLGINSDNSVLLFVGNLVPVKGLDVLLDALRQLIQSGERFKCFIIGEGPQRAQLLRLAAGTAPNGVTFVGSVPHERLGNWFRAADVFVLPSRSEGVPNVLLEASACGIPFVASAVGGIPEISGPCDRLVPPENASALADALREVLRSPAARMHHSRLAVRTRSQAAREMTDFMSQVVERWNGVTAQSKSTPTAAVSQVTPDRACCRGSVT